MSEYDNDQPISNFSEGIDRRYAVHSSAFPQGHVWDALNMVYLRDSEEPEKMRGLLRLGTTDLGGTVTGLVDYDEGTRLIAACSDGKWYEYAGTNWTASTGATGYDTTTTTRWAFAMFYGATTGSALLVGSNGIDAPEKYTSSAGASALGGSPPSTGKFPTTWIGRLWFAAGDVLHGSAVNDCEKWGRSNGGVQIQVDRGSGDITGMAVFAEHLIIFKREKILTIAPSTSFNVSDLEIMHKGVGTPSHHTIREGVSTRSAVLNFMSDNGAEALVPTSSTGGFYIQPGMSDAIKPILDRRSKTSLATAWGDFNPDRHEYSLYYGTTSTTPKEGVIANMARSSKSKIARWTRHNMMNRTAGCMFRSSNEQIQVIGGTNGRIYKMHTGDDRDSSPYEGTLSTAAYTQGAPHLMKVYGRYYVDVESEGTYKVSCRALLGRIGLPAPGSEEDLISFGGGDGWGAGAWGVAAWGGSGLAGKYVRLDTVRRGAWLRLQVSSSGSNQWWKLRQIMIESSYAAGVLAA